jgi:hypothetical protein
MAIHSALRQRGDTPQRCRHLRRHYGCSYVQQSQRDGPRQSPSVRSLRAQVLRQKSGNGLELATPSRPKDPMQYKRYFIHSSSSA